MKTDEPRTAPRVPVEGVAGYIVLTETNGAWKDDWDGEVHPTMRDGYAALKEARDACGAAFLVQCIRCPEPPEIGGGVPEAAEET